MASIAEVAVLLLNRSLLAGDFEGFVEGVGGPAGAGDLVHFETLQRFAVHHAVNGFGEVVLMVLGNRGERVPNDIDGLDVAVLDGQMYESSVIRYIFFGGCTTMVNLVSFFILRKLKVELNIANIISIILAILFAYVVNSKYVFQDKCETLKDHVQPFCKFVSARLVTMVIEVGGVWLLVSVMGLNDMIGKFLTQFIVLMLNYVFSKFFVFTTGKSK